MYDSIVAFVLLMHFGVSSAMKVVIVGKNLFISVPSNICMS